MQLLEARQLLAAWFQGLGDLEGGSVDSYASAITADGSTIIGTSSSSLGNEVFRWTKTTGMKGLGWTSPGVLSSADGAVITDGEFRWTAGDRQLVDLKNPIPPIDSYSNRGIVLSADGSTIFVTFPGTFQPEAGGYGYRWTADQGWQSFFNEGSGAYFAFFWQVSEDGRTIIGDVNNSEWSAERGVRWTASGGLEFLTPADPAEFTRALAVSADGTVTLGVELIGPYSNSPGAHLDLVRWSNDGHRTHVTIPSDWIGQSHPGSVGLPFITRDNRTVIGTVTKDASYPVHFTVFRWTQDGALERFPGGDDMVVSAMSDDGKVLLAEYQGTDAGSTGYWMWHEGVGWQRLNQVFQDNGLDSSGWSYLSPKGMSADGKTIYGNGRDPSGQYEPWAARLGGRNPVIVLPGIAGSFPTNAGFHDWLLNRGASPDTLRIDPLGSVYDPLIQTLKNAGYQDSGPDQDLFVATYDWRMPPAPAFDGRIDGTIGGLTAQGLIQDVEAGRYASGVDDLAYWLKRASDAWATAHPGDPPLDAVDVIAHSTGGLIARSYIQSAAYNGVYGQDSQGHDLRLPKIDNFVMLDVPNQGASKAWNPLQDNFAIDPIYEHVLAPIIDVAFTKLLPTGNRGVVHPGAVIHGPDGDISLADITNSDGSYNTAKFIALYVPTVQSLLATYNFTTNFNIAPDEQNKLLLDLNAGSGPSTFPDEVGKVFNVYGDGVLTPQTVTKLVWDGVDNGDRISSFTDPWSHKPDLGQTYYQDDQNLDGDGTVPLASLTGLFPQNTEQLENQPFDKRTGALGLVDHTGIVSNPFVQQQILADLGITVDLSQIAPYQSPVWNLPDILLARLDPVEGVLTDAGGRRLGYTTATGPLAEIPNSFYLGQADGIGFIFGSVIGPLTLDLTGLGGSYSVRVSGVQSDNVADLSVSGTLAAGESKSFDVRFAPPSADSIPPTTTASLLGALGSNGWYVGPVNVILAATDDLSGVAATQYRLDGGSWQTYVGSFPVSAEGVHSVDFYSTDSAGNLEATHTQVINVDQTPPTTTASLSGSLGSNGWYVGTVTVALPASDNLSGGALTQYRLDGGAMQTYTGTFNISSDGVHSVDYYSTDNAGNVEATHTQTITVDETKPVLAAATDPSTLWPPNGKMVSVNVSGKITDNLSGVDPTKVIYAVSDEYGQVQPSGTFNVNADGTYSFTIQLEARRDGKDKDGRVYSIAVTDQDQAGNQGTTQTVVTVPHDQGSARSSSASGFGPGRDAFVSTLYGEQLDRSPEHRGLRYWSGKLAAGMRPQTAASAIWRSPEHRALVRQQLAPPITLGHSFRDALRAGRQVAPCPTPRPGSSH